MTYLSTDQNHSSGASGHHFCLTGQVDFAIRLVDSVQNFPKEIIIIIVVVVVIIIITIVIIIIIVRSLIYLLFFKYWLVLFQ